MPDLPEFNAEEFRRLTSIERVVVCRRLAVQTRGLARASRPEHRAGYLKVAREWLKLADEIRTPRIWSDDRFQVRAARLCCKASSEVTRKSASQVTITSKLNLKGAPPIVWFEGPTMWVLRRADDLEANLKAAGFHLSRRKNGDLEAFFDPPNDQGAGTSAAKLRALGFAFHFVGKERSPSSYLKGLRSLGLFKGEFAELYFTRAGDWKVRFV
jgi:hypothetical protein